MNWQVVIMRPSHQANDLADYVNQNVGEAVLLPMLEIVPLSVDAKGYSDIKAAEYVIISSQNAVQFAPDELIALLKDKKNFTLGPSTTKALCAQGIPVAYTAPVGSQSETLLALQELQSHQIKDKRIVLLAGKGGRDLLETTLLSRGAHLSKVQTYQQLAIEYDLAPYFEEWKQSAKQICFVTTSLNILNNLVSQTPKNQMPWLFAQPHVVISDRIEQAAIGYGFQLIYNAKGAQMGSLTKALQNILKLGNTKVRS